MMGTDGVRGCGVLGCRFVGAAVGVDLGFGVIG